MIKDISNPENNLWFRFKGTDRVEEAYMSQGALDKLDHLGTSCPIKRGGDQCRIKVDGRYNFIHMALVRRIHRR